MYTEQLKQQAALLAKHPKFRENGIMLFRFADNYVCIGEFKQRAEAITGKSEFPNNEEELLKALRKFVAAGYRVAIIEPTESPEVRSIAKQW